MMELKDAYQEKAAAQLREWQGWINDFKSVTVPAKPAAPLNHQDWTERLEDCHRVATIRLHELSSTNEDHWELAKQAVERAMIDLKKVLDESGACNAAKIVRVQTVRSYVYEPFQRRG